MLQNAYFLAKIGADTAENERNFAQNWQLRYGASVALSGAADAAPFAAAAGPHRWAWADAARAAFDPSRIRRTSNPYCEKIPEKNAALQLSAYKEQLFSN